MKNNIDISCQAPEDVLPEKEIEKGIRKLQQKTDEIFTVITNKLQVD